MNKNQRIDKMLTELSQSDPRMDPTSGILLIEVINDEGGTWNDYARSLEWHVEKARKHLRYWEKRKVLKQKVDKRSKAFRYYLTPAYVL